ncbi:MAG: hypothetical protein C4K49_02080 [Candidatus Thorarchaeota archaeon]|nr:MAG: hypothetical protein C4K49_02080 [Candidatus Thorarchaeota archaeon]
MTYLSRASLLAAVVIWLERAGPSHRVPCTGGTAGWQISHLYVDLDFMIHRDHKISHGGLSSLAINSVSRQSATVLTGRVRLKTLCGVPFQEKG